jgi:hypothetical protein
MCEAEKDHERSSAAAGALGSDDYDVIGTDGVVIGYHGLHGDALP